MLSCALRLCTCALADGAVRGADALGRSAVLLAADDGCGVAAELAPTYWLPWCRDGLTSQETDKETETVE